MVRDKNKLVMFYPSRSGNHMFTDEDELPFERIQARNIVDVDDRRIVMFPDVVKKGGVQDCYLMDCYESGLVVKLAPMSVNRRTPLFVKVWGSLIYAIAGVADGSCERFDVNLNKWEPIVFHPSPYQIINHIALNILDKYIYLVGKRDNPRGFKYLA